MEVRKLRNLLIIVEDSIHVNDGYKTRIEMEIELLKEYFKIYVLIPKRDKEVTFRNKINILNYDAYSNNIPFVLNKYKLLGYLKTILKDFDDPILYFESLTTAAMVYDFCKCNNLQFVYDCHGTVPDEVLLYHNNIIGWLYSRWLRKTEKKIVKFADMVVTVSIAQTKLFNVSRKFVVLPMLPSKHFFSNANYRNEIRNKLNIGLEKKVFVYSGQMQKWQMAEETIKYYYKLSRTYKDTFLLVLTGQVEEFKELCAQYDIEYLVMSVNYAEMPKYLDACDYGFCIRDNSIVNRVASPTKVLEYVARGIKPILSSYVGDFSKLFKDNNIGFVIENFNDSISLDSTPIDARNFFSDYVDSNAKTYCDEIKRLNNNRKYRL